MHINVEKIRSKIARGFAGVFAAPYLPNSLIWVGLALAAASLVLVLVAQPLVYWLDKSQAASSLGFLKSLLQAGPLAYLGAALGYLALVWALTTLLTRRLALLAWLMAAYVHLAHLLLGLSQLLKLPSGADPLAGLVTLAQQALAALLVGAALSIWLVRRRAAPEAAPQAGELPEAIELPGAAPAALLPAKRRQVKGWQVALGLTLVMLLGAGGLWISSNMKSGWRAIKPAHSPGKRVSARVVYDTRAGKALLFGGGSEWLGNAWNVHNDLWAWDGSDWSQIVPQDPEKVPAARRGHGMAYDEQRGVLVLFGGETRLGYMNDTWEWDGVQWAQRYPENVGPSPSMRTAHTMFYDPTLGKVVVTGGCINCTDGKRTVDPTFYNDVWTWDGISWTQITSAVENPSITAAAAAYDAIAKNVVLVNHNGLYTWSGDHWSRLNSGSEPPDRQDALLTPLPSGGVALFGGYSEEKGKLSDLWFHTADGWQNPAPALQPPARNAHVFFYDPVRSALVVYGGFVNDEPSDDMWEYPLEP